MKRLKAFWRDDRGSISLLIMSLFMATVIVSVILTNISSIYLAKRALTQGVEAAAQRGVRNLDMDAYYRGEYNLWQFTTNLLGEGETDPGIPIDCEKGRADALRALNNWIQIDTSGSISNSRSNLKSIQVNRMECDGFQLTISASAEVELPFILPFIDIERFEISSTVSSIAQRKITTNFYGLEIG